MAQERYNYYKKQPLNFTFPTHFTGVKTVHNGARPKTAIIREKGSNSDVLGSAKGWARAFLYNEKAKAALENFYKRPDTMSVGICNGCQLLMELELINPEHDVHGKMIHNTSSKHESNFVSVKVQENNSIMLSTLAGSSLGFWITHGEGKFNLPKDEASYNIVAKYAYEQYPEIRTDRISTQRCYLIKQVVTW